MFESYKTLIELAHSHVALAEAVHTTLNPMNRQVTRLVSEAYRRGHDRQSTRQMC